MSDPIMQIWLMYGIFVAIVVGLNIWFHCCLNRLQRDMRQRWDEAWREVEKRKRETDAWLRAGMPANARPDWLPKDWKENHNA